MNIITNILFLLIGFAALIKGADFFVDGSSALARTFKVPSVIIGLTIIAMGTSAPELAVSTAAALNGSNEIALSNVVGSNLFNLLAVLGVCAIVCPIPIEKQLFKRDLPLSTGATLAVFLAVGLPALINTDLSKTAYSATVGEISRPLGIALLVIFAIYIAVLIVMALKNKTEDSSGTTMPVPKSLLFIAVGLVCIVIGGDTVVNNAKDIAAAFGMSETLIGLTIVALGTSLPELVTSVVASKKGENSLAVGNVVGSNLFNLLLILGVSGTIHPIAVNLASVIDLGILLAVSVMVLAFSAAKKITRAEGIVMVLLYAAAMTFAVIR